RPRAPGTRPHPNPLPEGEGASRAPSVLRVWRRGELAKLFIAFAGLHLLALLFLRPGGYVADWSDFEFSRSWAALSDRGAYPYLDFWMEYPPLTPATALVAYRVSRALPAAESRQ